MLYWRKTLSDNLFNPNFRLPFFHRCLRTKPGGHGSGDHYRKIKPERRGDDEEGKLQLFKSRGQHLLINPGVLHSIVQASNVKPDDTVLEIGPGTGNLTLELLEAARNVVAVEIDSRMVEVLRKRVAERGFEDRLNIINGDALRINFPKFNLVVANIPYCISSPLVAKLVYGLTHNPFRSATLLVQKEFAKKLLSKPGDSEFNRLAVNMNLVSEVEFVTNVSKRDFLPCPKVDSSVIKIIPKSQIPDVDIDEWWAFTRTCFSKKNKTLGATFKQKRKLMELMVTSALGQCSENSKFELFKGKVVSVLESGGFSDKRPCKLSKDDLLRLLSLFNEGGIYFHDQADAKGLCDDAFDDLM